ncbi:MAG: glycosyltransferase family 4 protein [Desulfobacteraceae bacterium]|nr:glycosyltransferase family 4 protein [Desulfobacteraceae bacterium]
MKIFYHMPFKPLGHANPSGDLIIGTELHDFLVGRGHHLDLAGRMRMRWIFGKPWLWPQLVFEIGKLRNRVRRDKPSLWLSYHSYYKAPDIIGYYCAKKLGLPYVIFQGIYSTKVRRRLKTLPGFWLNRRSLVSADFVFTNKRRDYTNLQRLIPGEKLMYIKPGLVRDGFRFDKTARGSLRHQWGIGDTPVLMCTAMFRPGVKTQGVTLLIEACGEIRRTGVDFQLVILGDGRTRRQLEGVADRNLPGQVRFIGQVPRQALPAYYSAADIFAFPGIEEGLGMVYLEAQACGLPVVALDGWGAAEAVAPGKTGFLARTGDPRDFGRNIYRLLTDPGLRRQMGDAAGRHIAEHHDLDQNYKAVETTLQKIADVYERKNK